MGAKGDRRGWLHGLRVWGRAVMVLAALLSVAQITMGLTGIPRGLLRWITAADVKLPGAPHTIVVLGGEGIPSESGLIRTYHAAAVARTHRGARVVCSLPADGDPAASSVGRMRAELVARGVAATRIVLEHRARNTHEQAVALRELLGRQALDEPLLLVTSPPHARRAVLSFRKAGFRSVACLAADSQSAEADMGHGRFLRYGFWSTLESEIRLARELVAICYYKLRGWA